MPNLNKFFEACGIPQYVWENAQEDSKIEPAEVAEYSATEQAISTWWISVRCNLTVHCSVTPFIIWQPIQRPRLLERVYKPMHMSH